MGELYLFFCLLVSLTIIFIIFLFFKDGYFIKTKIGNVITALFVFSVSYVSITAFPNNYIFQIFLSYLITIVGLLGALIIIVKNSLFSLGRGMILFSIICNLLLLIL